MSYQIFLPSYKRSNKQHTLENLPESLRSQVSLVVQSSEVLEYDEVADKYNVKELLVLPDEITSLSPTYEKIVKGYATEDKFFIMDDDLTFAYREFEDMGDKSLTRCNNEQAVEDMFAAMLQRLDTYAHVGLSARSGNNNREPEPEGLTWSENVRAMCFTGYQTDVVKQVQTNRVKCRDDFDRHLQLMRMGYANSVLYSYCYDQIGGSNSAGGCSEYRDLNMLANEAYELERLHPGFVTAKEKRTKSDWGVGGVRMDVTVQWKKAYASSGEL